MGNDKLVKPKFALISVSDKTGIIEFCKTLSTKYNVKIISTGGTYRVLKNNGIDVIEISEYTSSAEIMDGRVKTLHPKIHAGLLCDLDKKEHVNDLNNLATDKIDIVVVNLYPFFKTVLSDATQEEIIENIDIGGPSMIRSAAKNFKHTTIVTDIEDYDSLLSVMEKNNGKIDFETRYNLAKKAFLHTAYYDSIISTYLCKDDNFFDKKYLTIPVEMSQKLRYGENPQQNANYYNIPLCSNIFTNFQQFGGKELSYNNINDSISAIESVFNFNGNYVNNKKAVCIVKHNNPCCFAIDENEIKAYQKAIKFGDSLSAFGGIVVINGTIDESLANELIKIFYEVVICTDITQKAKEILNTKKNLRVIMLNKNAVSKSILQNLQIKIVNGSVLAQTQDNLFLSEKDIEFSSLSNAKLQIDEFIFAISLVKYISSNAICITYQNTLLAIGSGQTSRVDSVKIACQKAQQKCVELGIDISNVTLASDAFFPFSDNIEIIASYNIKNVIAPKGSIKDEEVKSKAKEKNINLVFSPNRFFRH